ncbi:MAG: hypothetical protein DBX55_06915 [Verrucomicrobia bacterium]|nr:MAG: hypothetical protein DBX55_06915 [Verrucomicrobiota bacterium]
MRKLCRAEKESYAANTTGLRVAARELRRLFHAVLRGAQLGGKFGMSNRIRSAVMQPQMFCSAVPYFTAMKYGPILEEKIRIYDGLFGNSFDFL